MQASFVVNSKYWLSIADVPWSISKNGVNTTFRSEDVVIFCNLQTGV